MNFINIKSKEKFPTLILFVMFFSIVAASITGSTIKDSTFLTYFEKSYLPIMYVIIAITMTAVIYFYKKLSFQKDQTNVILSTSLISLVLVSFFKDNLMGWYIPFFYVFIDIISIISIMQFWVLTGEIFDSRQAKRIFTFILAGGSFAGIIAGYGIRPFTAFYGTSSLINLTLFFIILTMLMSILIKPYRGTVNLEEEKIQLKGNIKINRISSYTKHIALLIALSSFISKIIDYQFKMTAANTYHSEAELVNFFGTYYASTGFFTLIMQFFATGLLLNRFGILAGLLLLPFAVLFGSMGFVLIGTLGAVYITKFSDQVIKFSTNSTTQEILWLPLSSNYKKQIKPTIDGSLKSIFEGLAGILIFTIIYFNIIPESKIHLLSFITIFSAIIWIWNSFKLKEGYISSLVGSIENRQLNLDKTEIDIKDAHTVQTIENSLETENELKQLFTIDLLWRIPLHPWQRTIRSLFMNSTLAVKRGILELTWINKKIIPDNYIVKLISDKNELTPSAIRCAYERDIKNLEEIIQPLLYHASASISSSVAVIMLKKSNKNRKSRSILDDIISKGNQQDLLSLLLNIQDHPICIKSDDLINIYINGDYLIKNNVLKILIERPDILFFEIIFEALLIPATRKNAKRALTVSNNNPYKKHLLSILMNPTANKNSKIQILRIIDHLETSIIFIDKIISFLENMDLIIVEESSDTLLKLSKITDFNKSTFLKINKNIDTLALRTLKLLHFKKIIETQSNSELLTNHINSDIQNLIVIMIKLGTLNNPKVPVENYIRYIKTNDKKILPSVLELVESTFSNEARRVLLPLIDPDSNINLFSQKFIEGIELNEENFLINWIQSSHQWKIVISLEYLLKEEKVSILKNIKWKKIYNFDYTFFNSNQINYLKRNFTYKEIAINRKNNMYSILEKTLILKSVELFQEIPGEVLSNIAQISKELNLEAGQSIFMEGDHGDSLYIIIDGGVSIIKEKKEIALLGHGNCIGEMALLDQEPRSADAICIKDSILLEIDQLGFYELMASNDVIMKQIIRILTKRLRETNKKLTVGLK